MPRGQRQAIEIGREAFLLGAWRDRLGAHDAQVIMQNFLPPSSFDKANLFYNTVVLAGCRKNSCETLCFSRPVSKPFIFLLFRGLLGPRNLQYSSHSRASRRFPRGIL